MRLIILMILLLVSMMGCSDVKVKLVEQAKGGEVSPLDGEKLVPFELNSAHVITLHPEFNGREIPIVLDTGGMTMIGREVADTLNLELHATPQEGVSLAKVESIRLNGVEVRNLKAAVMPFGDTFKISNIKLDGMLGSDFLRFFQVTFDYNRNEITFRNPSKLTKENQGDLLLKMKIIAPYFPTVQTKVNSKMKLNGMIDTGLNHAFVLPYELLEKFPDARVMKAKGFFAKWPFTEQQRNALALIDEIRIGDKVLKDVPVLFADLPNMLDEGTMLIGKHFLDDYRTTLDYPNRMVLLQETDPIEQSLSFSTGVSIIRRLDKLIVRGVWEGSPADLAGINPEDEILTINGLEATALDNHQIQEWIDDPSVKELKLTRLVNGEVEEINLVKVNLFPAR